MDTQYIALKKRQSYFTYNISDEFLYVDPQIVTCNANMIRLGFIMSEKLYKHMLYVAHFGNFGEDLIDALKKIVGDDVVYRPMYKNFPREVMEKSECELFLNAIHHYWSSGQWLPESYKISRKYKTEKNNLKVIDIIDQNEFKNIFYKIASSNDSISQEDQKILEWFIDNWKNLNLNNIEINNKEILAIIGGKIFENDKYDLLQFIKTSTDILRIVTYLSQGDVSLSSNTEFKSLKRFQRRKIVSHLERVINEEDIKRHKNKWIKLFHSLHIGEYKFAKKCNQIAKKIRKNENLFTVNSVIEDYIKNKDIIGACLKLQKRPGEFARRLDNLIRISKNRLDIDTILSYFLMVVNKISTRVLLQLYAHFNSRNNLNPRIAFPKGNTQKAILIPSHKYKINDSTIVTLLELIQETLEKRFSELDNLGKCYIDPLLYGCPIPSQMRSVSVSSNVVARGTRIPFDDKRFLRFFIYWIGKDIDLSATMHDENFGYIDHISYTNLKSGGYACHSGDITYALNGASEFINIDLKEINRNIRYIVMNVLVYTGPVFSEHKKVYAGFMTRDHAQYNEIYDPATVKAKFDLTQKSYNSIPLVFDLKNKEVIYCDLTTPSKIDWYGNNIESNFASIKDVLTSITSLDNKFNLYDLFRIHVSARGNIVNNPKKADTIFSHKRIDDTDQTIVTPYDINIINSEFIK